MWADSRGQILPFSRFGLLSFDQVRYPERKFCLKPGNANFPAAAGVLPDAIQEKSFPS